MGGPPKSCRHLLQIGTGQAIADLLFMSVSFQSTPTNMVKIYFRIRLTTCIRITFVIFMTRENTAHWNTVPPACWFPKLQQKIRIQIYYLMKISDLLCFTTNKMTGFPPSLRD